ncbi:MAG: PAS domain-containing protein [Chloroflexi bacterium]|nr:PAS domain-containing protein [Chloroflexota bacterium]
MSSDSLTRIQHELRLHDRALASSSCGITIADALDPDLPLIYVNDAFEKITGYPPAEVIGRNCRFLQRDDRDQPGLTDLRAALRAGEDSTIILRNYRRDGSLFWNELFTSPVIDEDGNLTHFVGIQTDVTKRVEAEESLRHERAALERTLAELRQTEAMLVHSEKMNALGQVVAGVAHEINNPVAFVNSNLHSLSRAFEDVFGAYDRLETLILGGAFDPAEVQAVRSEADLDFLRADSAEAIQSSLGGLKRVRTIVDELRIFGRPDEAELKIANIKENLESTLVIAKLELQGRVKVVLDLDDLPDIRCYPAQLNQVFLNLIINAAQAIDGRGVLTIRGRDAGDSISLQFSDTGRGMSPDLLGRIFEPFFTTKPVGAGTGLGLAIAYRIITDRHQGAIHVESTPGIGSTFTITLPKDLRP